MLPFTGFPFAPRNSSLLSFLGAGIPVLGLTLWAIPGQPLKAASTSPWRVSLCRRRCSSPAWRWRSTCGCAITTRTPTSAATPSSRPRAETLDYALPYAQTATIVFMILCSLLLLPFTVPPVRFFTGGAPLRGDWRPTWLALALAGCLALTLALPLGRTIWELTALPLWLYGVDVVLDVVWGLLVKGIWRASILDRVLACATSPRLKADRRRP